MDRLAEIVRAAVAPDGRWGYPSWADWRARLRHVDPDRAALLLVVHLLHAYAAERGCALRGATPPWQLEPPGGFFASPDTIRLLSRPSVRAGGAEWFAARGKTLTASVWPSIFDRRKAPIWVTAHTAFRSTTGAYPAPFRGNAATAWGHAHESLALDLYEQREKTLVVDTGFLVGEGTGATPDGVRLDTLRLLEVKCPFTRRDVVDLERHYWSQMQAQMAVTGAASTDFTIYCPEWDRIYVAPVARDDVWLSEEALPLARRIAALMQRIRQDARGEEMAVSLDTNEVVYRYVPFTLSEAV